MGSMATAFEPRNYAGKLEIEQEARRDPFAVVEAALHSLRDGRDFVAETADEGLVVLAARTSRKSWRTRLLLPARVPDFGERHGGCYEGVPDGVEFEQ
jgi:hypothetical protein